MATVKKIYEGLKRHDGSIKELANRQGCSREWVRQVLNGSAEDTELVLAAAKLWKELELEEKNRKLTADRLAAEAEELSTQNFQLA